MSGTRRANKLGVCVQSKHYGLRNEAGRVERRWNVILWAGIADHVVMIVMRFVERTWPLSSELLKDMPDFDPYMFGCGRRCLVSVDPRNY